MTFSKTTNVEGGQPVTINGVRYLFDTTGADAMNFWLEGSRSTGESISIKRVDSGQWEMFGPEEILAALER